MNDVVIENVKRIARNTRLTTVVDFQRNVEPHIQVGQEAVAIRMGQDIIGWSIQDKKIPINKHIKTKIRMQ